MDDDLLMPAENRQATLDSFYTETAQATGVSVTDDTLTTELADGRTLSVPLEWFPRLCHGTPAERKNWQLIAQGQGIHWPDLDKDISIEGLLLGKPSAESPESLQKWLMGRSSAG